MEAEQKSQSQAWLTLVGLTESGWTGLSEEARAAVLSAELLVGGQRHLEHMPEVAGQERLAWPSPIQQGIEVILARAGRPVCVLASGDPFWFGIGATLSRHLPPAAMRCLPGPSAFSLACAQLGWALQDVHCLSVVARDLERLRTAFAPGRRLLILSEDGKSPEQIARLLVNDGFGASPMIALEAMGGADAARQQATAAAWGTRAVHKLNTLAVECRADRPGAVRSRTPGRSEAEFAHDGQISKREVRAVILALLAPRGGEHLWDVGAGSGAVSVEWLLSDRANRATAVEAHPERLNKITANAHTFGVTHLHTVAGRAPQALAGLAPPDAVFIGGGLTEPGLLDACWQALSPGGRLVASAVTLEGEAVIQAAQARLGGELVRLSVERSEPLGGFTGWRPLRAVTLWHCCFPATTSDEPL